MGCLTWRQYHSSMRLGNVEGTTRELPNEKGPASKETGPFSISVPRNGKRPGPRRPGLFLAKGWEWKKRDDAKKKYHAGVIVSTGYRPPVHISPRGTVVDR